MNRNPGQRVVPTLRIRDYERSKAFYVDGLGFRVVWEHRFQPNFPVFAEITRDGMLLFLTEHAGDCEFGALVHFYVESVDRWFAELSARKIHIDEPPNEDLQGLRSMGVRDPDGNKVRISTRLTHWVRSRPAADI